MAKKPTKKGWHKEDVKAAIRKRFVSFAELAKLHDTRPDYLRAALIYPKPKAEGIIAQALGVSAADIWPERYTREILSNNDHWRRRNNLDANQFKPSAA